MRFLNIETCKMETKEEDAELEEALAKCAIISHRWGEHELSFQQYEERIKNSSYKNQFDNPGPTPLWNEGQSEGFLKLARARLKARHQEPTQPQFDLKYIWMDTCCIDKENQQELAKTFTMMFRLYRSATVTFAQLPDVSATPDGFQELVEEKDTKKVIKPRVGCLESSDWFTRGWTLQELLAPTTMYFFDRYWRFIGTKNTLSARIEKATQIKAQYLHGDISQACIAVKMSWLARRRTAKIEDMAYCMFGIFGISTFIRYGEGEGAFLRLGEELLRQHHSDESIFAWRSPTGTKNPESPIITSCGLLAPWPTCYLESGNLTIRSRRYAPRKGLEAFKVAGGGIELQAPNKLPANGNAAEWMKIRAALRRNYWLKLNCCEAGTGIRNTITIHLRKEKGSWRKVDCERWSYRWRPRSSRSIFGPKTGPIDILQRVQGEEDWGHMLAQNPRF